MLSGKELILATRSFAKEDVKKSWFYTIQTFSLLLFSLAGVVLLDYVVLQIFLSIISGLLIVRTFVLYHDYMHEAILRKSKLANVLFQIFGVLVLAPKSVWKSSHNFHHQNNSKLRLSAIGSYLIFSKEKFEKSSKKVQLKYLFMRHPITILFGYIFTFLIGMCINPLRVNFKKHYDSLLALLVHLALYIISLYFFGLLITLLLITVPNFIAGASGAYLFYIQHNFPNAKFKSNIEWTYEGAALESSSFLNAHPMVHWFIANIGYHHIHHLNARIPFYRLPEVMEHFPELQKPKTTSLSFSEIRACLRLKVWDIELQKMTGV